MSETVRVEVEFIGGSVCEWHKAHLVLTVDKISVFRKPEVRKSEDHIRMNSPLEKTLGLHTILQKKQYFAMRFLNISHGLSKPFYC